MPSPLTKSNKQVCPSVLETVLKRNNLKLIDLAEKLGVNKSSVSRWCLGETEMELNTRQWKVILSLIEEAGLTIREIPDDWYKRKLRN